MNILITNDDGIQSEGLATLVDALSDEYDVYVAAPMSQRSAFSHSVTYFYKDNRCEERKVPGAVRAWAIDGTPADCAYYGVCGAFGVKPDLVISGINFGRNMASDVIYSGTVAAAGEAMILGTPGIAVSLCAYDGGDFRPAAECVRKLIPLFMKSEDRHRFILNINVPKGEIRGVKVTDLHDHVDYKRPVLMVEKDGQFFLRLDGDEMIEAASTKERISDVEAVEQGYIAVTPLNYDMCARMYFEQIDGMEKIDI
ncbi:MAG: 5'/3'-nucleotidase SurE [Erysipelotrichaceae bacterium]|nr:5'/3'-nucleotidase SurE [Erysipelotrichaceae bacterium]